VPEFRSTRVLVPKCNSLNNCKRATSFFQLERYLLQSRVTEFGGRHPTLCVPAVNRSLYGGMPDIGTPALFLRDLALFLCVNALSLIALIRPTDDMHFGTTLETFITFGLGGAAIRLGHGNASLGDIFFEGHTLDAGQRFAGLIALAELANKLAMLPYAVMLFGTTYCRRPVVLICLSGVAQILSLASMVVKIRMWSPLRKVSLSTARQFMLAFAVFHVLLSFGTAFDSQPILLSALAVIALCNVLVLRLIRPILLKATSYTYIGMGIGGMGWEAAVSMWALLLFLLSLLVLTLLDVLLGASRLCIVGGICAHTVLNILTALVDENVGMERRTAKAVEVGSR
jgi:hypothetical protein